MNRYDRPLTSLRPYAVDLASWRRGDWWANAEGEWVARQDITAIWFRRKKGVTVAHLGRLWATLPATDPKAFLELHTDGRYGGDWTAAWDGERAWAQQVIPKTDLDAHTQTLDAALQRFLADKALPKGYDGWWSFL